MGRDKKWRRERSDSEREYPVEGSDMRFNATWVGRWYFVQREDWECSLGMCQRHFNPPMNVSLSRWQIRHHQMLSGFSGDGKPKTTKNSDPQIEWWVTTDKNLARVD